MKYIIAGVTFGTLLFILLILGFLYKPTNTKTFQVKSLILASTQWLESSKKDKNKVGALMHVNYASAFLHSARSLLSDQEIEDMTNVSVDQLLHNIETHQQKCLDALKGEDTETDKKSKRFVYRAR